MVQALFARLYSSAIAKMGPVDYHTEVAKAGVFSHDFGCEDTFKAFHAQFLYQISLLVEKIARVDGVLGVKLAGSTVEQRLSSGDCTAVKVVVRIVILMMQDVANLCRYNSSSTYSAACSPARKRAPTTKREWLSRPLSLDCSCRGSWLEQLQAQRFSSSVTSKPSPSWRSFLSFATRRRARALCSASSCRCL